METNTSPTPRLEWNGPTSPVPERSKHWYTIAGAMMIGCTAYAILTGNWSFAVTVVLLAGVYYISRNAAPHFHHIIIDPSGVTFDNTEAPWSDCASFSILQFHSHNELIINRRSNWSQRWKIQLLPGIDPSELREYLSQILPENTDVKEHLIDYFIRILKL